MAATSEKTKTRSWLWRGLDYLLSIFFPPDQSYPLMNDNPNIRVLPADKFRSSLSPKEETILQRQFCQSLERLGASTSDLEEISAFIKKKGFITSHFLRNRKTSSLPQIGNLKKTEKTYLLQVPLLDEGTLLRYKDEIYYYNIFQLYLKSQSFGDLSAEERKDWVKYFPPSSANQVYESYIATIKANRQPLTFRQLLRKVKDYEASLKK